VVTSLQEGVLIAVGILLDTLVIRSPLVPALRLDVGWRIWWRSRSIAPTAPHTFLR
jgi:RND superfamily putative drug exporter